MATGPTARSGRVRACVHSSMRHNCTLPWHTMLAYISRRRYTPPPSSSASLFLRLPLPPAAIVKRPAHIETPAPEEAATALQPCWQRLPRALCFMLRCHAPLKKQLSRLPTCGDRPMAALESSANWRMVAPPLPMMLPHSAAGTSKRSSCCVPSLQCVTLQVSKAQSPTSTSTRRGASGTYSRCWQAAAMAAMAQQSGTDLESMVSCTAFSLDIFASTRCSAVSTCHQSRTNNHTGNTASACECPKGGGWTNLEAPVRRHAVHARTQQSDRTYGSCPSTQCSTWPTVPLISMTRSLVPGKYSFARDSWMRAELWVWNSAQGEFDRRQAGVRCSLAET